MTADKDLDSPVEGDPDPRQYALRLYVVDNTPRSNAALANLKRICEKQFPGQYQIEVVDLLKNPQLARNDQILAVPTVVRRLPLPVRRMIGDLSSTERVLDGLDLDGLDNPRRDNNE